VCSLLAILAAAFDWTLLDWFPGLMFMPGHLFVTLIPLAACAIWAMAELFWVPRGGLRHAAPLLVCALAVLVLLHAPFTRIWLAGNFWWHLHARAEIVRQVEGGTLAPNVAHNSSLIALGRERRNVSAGGNDIKVETRDGKPWVLFFTFRGINHYSGFLHVPEGGDPGTFADLADRRHQVVAYAARWYFVAR
jgi:hypothetical protein